MHNSRHASFLAAFLSDSHRNLETLFSTSVERDMKIVDLPTGDTGLLCSTFKLLCFTINLPSAKDALWGENGFQVIPDRLKEDASIVYF